MPTYTALRGIPAPGTSVFGYQRGHDVPTEVVESWDLVVGEAADPNADVVEGTIPEVIEDAPPVRPDDLAVRAEWEAWGLANGMDADEVAAASLDDLMAVEAKTAATGPQRPADSAKKAEWVAYVTDHPQASGDDKAWATNDATTKAELQAWQPGGQAVPGDTVAVAATEANQA